MTQEALRTAAEASRQPGWEFAGARILVVDDFEPMRKVICRHLAAVGAETSPASNGAEALELARAREFELIIMDIDMPGIDGMSACRALRTSTPAIATPVIFLTGRDDDTRHVQALEAGGDDFIAKPVSTPVLLARAGQAIRRYRAERQNQALHREISKYVSRPVRQARVSAGIERLEATILFSDLRGFTAMTVAEDAELMFKAISAVLAFQTTEVHRHGGYVDKFSGDGMLAVFEGPDAPLRACRAALAVVGWARGFHGISFWQPPPIGLGIHHGPFVRGDLGGADQREWTVIGTTVNLAARLCGVAGPLEIVVSEAVHQAVAGQVRTKGERDIFLKGLPQAAKMFVLADDDLAGSVQ